ncbi:hypothetical protein TorRG33x02_325590, partial [Trema orientale]
MVNMRSGKKSDSPAAAKGKLSSLSTLMKKKSASSSSVAKLQKLGSMAEPLPQPPLASEQNVSVQAESIVGISIAPPSVPIVPIHAAEISNRPSVTSKEGSSILISGSLKKSMQTDVPTSAPLKLKISMEGLDEKVPPATSNVPISSVDDAAKDAMDTSPLPEDDFSPRYTPENTPEKNVADIAQTASTIPSDVPKSVADPEISTSLSAEMCDVPTSPIPLVPVVNIEPNLQKSVDVPNISTQADPPTASVPVSPQQPEADVLTSPQDQTPSVAPEQVTTSKTKKKFVTQKVSSQSSKSTQPKKKATAAEKGKW